MPTKRRYVPGLEDDMSTRMKICPPKIRYVHQDDNMPQKRWYVQEDYDLPTKRRYVHQGRENAMLTRIMPTKKKIRPSRTKRWYVHHHDENMPTMMTPRSGLMPQRLKCLYALQHRTPWSPRPLGHYGHAYGHRHHHHYNKRSLALPI